MNRRNVINAWWNLRALPLLLAACSSVASLAQVVPTEVPTDSTVAVNDQFVNEAIVLNSSTWSVLINVTPKKEAVALQGSQFILAPGKSMKIAHYETADDFVSPVDMMTVTGTMTNRKGKTTTIGVLMMEKRKVSATQRTYYYHVMSGGGFGVSF